MRRAWAHAPNARAGVGPPCPSRIRSCPPVRIGGRDASGVTCRAWRHIRTDATLRGSQGGLVSNQPLRAKCGAPARTFNRPWPNPWPIGAPAGAITGSSKRRRRAKNSMARPGLEPGTPRFSGDPPWPQIGRNSLQPPDMCPAVQRARCQPIASDYTLFGHGYLPWPIGRSTPPAWDSESTGAGGSGCSLRGSPDGRRRRP